MSLLATLRRDAFRYTGRDRSIVFCLRHHAGFRYTFWFRCAARFAARRIDPRYVVARLMLSRTMYKYGIDIPHTTVIGDGLYIGHFGGIVISPAARLGRNVNISQGVTIGARYRDGSVEAPVIGNSVYLGPGAKIIGACVLEDGCVVGANAVVTRDQPANAVIVGAPARAIKYTGSAEYCINVA